MISNIIPLYTAHCWDMSHLWSVSLCYESQTWFALSKGIEGNKL